MKKLMVLVLLFLLLGINGVVDNLDNGNQLQVDSTVMANHDPGDGGMGSWK